jgi:hypothetical protein
VADRFVRVGVAPYPAGDGTPQCGVYEWTPGGQKTNRRFKVRFLSPDGEPGPRTFYVESLLNFWLNDEPTRSLEEACAFGYKVLAEIDPPSADDRDIYKLLQALFRNRHEGHARVGQQFGSALDFVDFGPGGYPRLLTPGLGEDAAERAPAAGATVHREADRLLREALGQGGKGTAGKLSGAFPRVLAAYERLLEVPPPPECESDGRASYCFPIDELPGRGKVDLLFTDGLVRGAPWKGENPTDRVRLSLIYGPVTSEDEKEAVKDPDFKRFVRKLGEAARTLGGRAFDEWLKNRQQHGYLSLVGGSGLKGTAREEAAARARRFYSLMMWMAYERMARCYGALMLLAYVDFCLAGEGERDPEEKWLFRQWHLPQLYLAALPLDFLGRSQLRWVILALQRLWWGGVDAPECYDQITDLLGVSGALVRERREADRRTKAAPARTYTTPAGPEVLSDLAAKGDYLPPDPVRVLSSPDCPVCGEKLQLSDSGTPDLSERSRTRLPLYCPGCDVDREYVVDLDEFLPKFAPGSSAQVVSPYHCIAGGCVVPSGAVRE